MSWPYPATLQRRPVGTVSSNRLCRITGLTYRRLDYWVRTGAIPEGLCVNPAGGSGSPRRWTDEAVEVLTVAARVANALAFPGGGGGLETRWIRKVIEATRAGDQHIVIAPGVHLTWSIAPAFDQEQRRG